MSVCCQHQTVDMQFTQFAVQSPVVTRQVCLHRLVTLLSIRRCQVHNSLWHPVSCAWCTVLVQCYHVRQMHLTLRYLSIG
jgi:hypothetical protein